VLLAAPLWDLHYAYLLRPGPRAGMQSGQAVPHQRLRVAGCKMGVDSVPAESDFRGRWSQRSPLQRPTELLVAGEGLLRRVASRGALRNSKGLACPTG
jgi:hypothetical protein